MSVEFYQQPHDAARALWDYLVGNPKGVDKETKMTLLEMLAPGKSVSFAVAEAAELIFARKSELPNDLVKLGASLATTASFNQINTFAEVEGNDRGRRIVTALRRHSGEKAPVGVKWSPKEEDPQPLAKFLPEGETPELPEPVILPGTEEKE